MRLLIFAEGATELHFAGSVVAPHLANLGIDVRSILISHGGPKGSPHRGGGGRYLPMKRDIERTMLENSGSDVRFSTMLDLYALAKDFPGFDEARELRPYDRVARLEANFHEDLGSRRFVPYIQLHEFESAILSDPECLADLPSSRTNREGIQRLAKVVEETARISPDGRSTPELVDDGRETAPSRRIISEFPQYRDAKGPVAARLAAKVGLLVIRSRCPHFDRWISRLERLASEPSI